MSVASCISHRAHVGCLHTGIPADATYVTAGGRVLESGPLESFGLQALSTVNVCVRMVGGKFMCTLAGLAGLRGSDSGC